MGRRVYGFSVFRLLKFRVLEFSRVQGFFRGFGVCSVKGSFNWGRAQ